MFFQLFRSSLSLVPSLGLDHWLSQQLERHIHSSLQVYKVEDLYGFYGCSAHDEIETATERELADSSKSLCVCVCVCFP